MLRHSETGKEQGRQDEIMNVSAKDFISALKKQISKSRQALVETGYSEVPVRARIVRLARRYGSPSLDVGTGACGCMAVALARRGLKVTAIDSASSAVRMAEERASSIPSEIMEVRHADASHLPFPDRSYRLTVAFDVLCHASDPSAILKEMFRLSDCAVVISELNSAGRRVTHHHDGGFETKLPGLLADHCQNCQRFDDTHHVTYVCERF